MKVLITGATGFVGSHMVEYLKTKKKIQLTILSRKKRPIKFKNLECKWICADIANISKQNLITIGKQDILLHLAWGGLPNYQSNYHVKKELKIQKIFFEKIFDLKIKKIITSGTCYEYGMREGCLQSHFKTNPIVQYAIAKDKLRQWLKKKSNKKSIILIWARLFFVFGDGQSSSSLFSKIKQAEKKKIKNFNLSDGKQKRDFIHVSSVIKKLYKLFFKNESIIYNVCSGKPQSLKSHILKLKKKSKLKINLIFGNIPYNGYEPLNFWGKKDV